MVVIKLEEEKDNISKKLKNTQLKLANFEEYYAKLSKDRTTVEELEYRNKELESEIRYALQSFKLIFFKI